MVSVMAARVHALIKVCVERGLGLAILSQAASPGSQSTIVRIDASEIFMIEIANAATPLKRNIIAIHDDVSERSVRVARRIVECLVLVRRSNSGLTAPVSRAHLPGVVRH